LHNPNWSDRKTTPTVFLIISYVFSSTKSEKKRAEQFLPASGEMGVRRREEVAQTMYTHVSKCKHKIKERKKS
jgi:hypothetical protein